MNNAEFFKEPILRFIKQGKNFGKIDGKIIECNAENCKMCEFNSVNMACGINCIDWLYEEYVERTVPTHKEQMFCKGLEYGYIARDADGVLHWHEVCPQKEENGKWLAVSSQIITISFPLLTFDFIKWEDETPWSVFELANMNIEQN